MKDYNFDLKKIDNICKIREKNHYFQILNNINHYFKWEAENITIPRNLEILLRQNGMLAFFPDENKFAFASPIRYDSDNEIESVTCIGFGTDPKAYGDVKTSDVILLKNNALGISDESEFRYFSFIKSQNDISRLYQLINSRLIPIIQADSDKAKKAIEEAFNKLIAGQPAIVVTSIMEDIKTLDILDPNNIAKMEYLTSYDEVLDKNIANRYGASLDIKDKKAQVNNMELKAYDDITTANFLSNYIPRLEFCEKMKESGFNISCVVNPIFADEPSEEEIKDPELLEMKSEQKPEDEEKEKEENEEN